MLARAIEGSGRRRPRDGTTVKRKIYGIYLRSITHF